MRLPGQLKDTTLGDLLGALFREKTDGNLDLIEKSGRQHRICLRKGRVESVETEARAPLLGELLELAVTSRSNSGRRLGESLLEQGLISERQLSLALGRQNLARLECLFLLKDAAIRFRAPRPFQPETAAPAPLNEQEVLHGRARSQPRDKGSASPALYRRQGALEVLGLSPSATHADLKRAFRTLAAAHHPDRYYRAAAAEQLRQRKRFAEISRAYHSLTG